jgi:pyruvate kinase
MHARVPAKCASCQVSDIADVVRQRADALMLCGESAAGRYPQKSMEVLRTVAARVEEWVR